MLRLISWKSLFVIALIALFSYAVQAQGVRKPPKYEKASEVTLKGTVEEVKLIPGPDEGAHFVLATADGPILVHVAPEKFLKEIVDTTFHKGDLVEVVGAKIKAEEGPEVLAKEITRDNNTLTLRDPSGTPVWKGWIR
ncbi:MAG TPA: hypothetical protein VEG32_04055 [Clostridia bacterium]|nr:hypothetical protein [Clostridia bacterium]